MKSGEEKIFRNHPHYRFEFSENKNVYASLLEEC